MTDEESLVPRIRTFLLEPDIFFKNLAEQPPRYRWPLLIALIAGIFSAVSTYLVSSWIFSFLITGFAGTTPGSGLTPSIFGIIMVAASVFAVFNPFITIVIAGFCFYIIAGLVSKGGSLAHAVTAAGWGIIPLAIYEALQIPLFLAFRPGMSVTISPEFFSLMNNSTSASNPDREAMMHMVTFSQPYYTFAMVNAGLHVLALLCCAWFWIPAVKNTCAVSQRHAVMIVLIPLLLYLAVTFGPVLISGGHGL